MTNLTSTIERLKREGVWTYAADMDGEDYADLDLSGPIALVIGAEGEGVSRRVLESCDRTISVPIRGKLDSLNASVAAGVLMYACCAPADEDEAAFVRGRLQHHRSVASGTAGGMAAGRVP